MTPPPSPRRSLVLGGGGLAGIAWELGVLAGLAERGTDLVSGAALVVGTSAGASVGAMVLADGGLGAAVAAQRRPAGETAEFVPALDLDLLAEVFALLGPGRGDPGAARRRVGALALEAVTVPEDVRRAVIAARLPVDRWPDRPFLVTAVDAVTGDRVTFGADDGVPLVDAVAASCAVPGVWPPVTLGGRRYVDGGVASLTNADLAAGSDRTVVLSPMERLSGGGDDPGGPGPTVPPRPLVVAADDAAVAAFGPNALDPACRVPALEAGLRQAASVAEAVAAYWAV